MGFEIVSGEGERYKLVIDKFNRAQVLATVFSQEHHAGIIEESFWAGTDLAGNPVLTIPNNFNGPVLSIKNNNVQRRMSLQKFYVSSDTAGVRYSLTRNPVEGALGAQDNVAAANVPNLNYGSAKSPQVSMNIWDNATGLAGITGFTSGLEYSTMELDVGTFIDPVDGAELIEASNIILFNMANNTGGDAIVSFNVRFFFEGIS